MCRRLRTRLDEITNDVERYPLDTHPQCLAELALSEPNSIVCLQAPEPLRTYNCIMHALDLVGRMAEYDPYAPVFASTAFVDYLIGDQVLRRCERQAGALITWSTAEGLKHVGKLIAPDRAESKWGQGILCEHGLEELPVRYGDVSGFYSPIDPGTALDHLRRFHFSN